MVTLFKSPCGLTFIGWGYCNLCFWHEPTKLACSFLFCSCFYFCFYGPFSYISFHNILWTTLHFLILFFWSYLCFIGPFNYFFMKVSFSPDIILCGWLGLKHQLTTYLTLFKSLGTLFNTGEGVPWFLLISIYQKLWQDFCILSFFSRSLKEVPAWLQIYVVGEKKLTNVNKNRQIYVLVMCADM